MSRLLNNSDVFRDQLEARNLFTPENPYDANNSNTVNAINSIADVIAPFGSFDLSNTVVGRLIGNNTPLAQIGLQMLSVQFGATAASNAAAEFLPSINITNLFDGDPTTKLITRKIDFQITRRETQTNIGRILEEIAGTTNVNDNPFSENSNNIDFVRNTGKGQLQSLFDNLNRNRYKPSEQQFISVSEEEGFDYGNLDSATIKQFFLDNNQIFYPFNQYKISSAVNIASINNRLNDEIRSFRDATQNEDGYLSYGMSQEFIDGLGTSIIRNNNDGSGNYRFENFAENNYGLEDDVTQQIVWGRDGVDANYIDDAGSFDNPIEGVQPSEEGGVINKVTDFRFSDNSQAFDLEAGGLLSYTRELLNSKGRYASFDLTRKKFIDENEQLHFNGSPLTRRLTGEIDRNRQHSISDPYNSFVKAIRYNGNKIYNGNPNSVIYNSVIPNITPSRDNVSEENPTISRNLMFSIENLAIEVNKDENIGYVSDSMGTEIPLCEVGDNGGRVMWFPPYDIQLTENVVVNRETTNFIGRGEPIYTYANTERLANLSFKLLIDYPPQVKGLNHVDAARFFAFGGENNRVSTSNIGDKERRREQLIQQRDAIRGTKRLADPQIPERKLNFFFANDEPKIGQEANTVQRHVSLDYETNSDISLGPDGRNNDLNDNFLDNIDQVIQDLLVDDTKRPYVQIVLNGSASQLFRGDNGEEYNLLLSSRRIEGIFQYINERYVEFTGRSLDRDGIRVFRNTLGAQGGAATDDVAEIPSDAAKQARRVEIIFTHNGVQVEEDVPISETERQTRDQLQADIDAINTQIDQQRNNNNTFGCEFTPYTIEDGVLKGFNATENNKYQPVFHSQTPEDFHRRLTFLHQCTRQGEAVRKIRENDNTFSANNAVFGRQPVQVLRIGDFYHTKVIIDNMQIDYVDSPWDMNPEGMGMQFMLADVKLQLKLIGGQSLRGPINALQNAISYNYYANSTYYNDGVYANATRMEDLQYRNDPSSENGNVDVEGNDPTNPRQALNGVTPNT